MSSRSFARSVVVTISLAELACGSEGTRTNNPPPPKQEPKTAKTETDEKKAEPEKKAPEIPRTKPGTDLPPEEPSGYAENNPYPPPGNRIVTDASIVQLQQEGRCVETKKIECKPGKHCNPPPPQRIECPKELQLPEPKKAEAVFQRRDRICYEPEAGACTPGADGCENPAARRVVCPPTMQAPDIPEPPEDDDGHEQE